VRAADGGSFVADHGRVSHRTALVVRERARVIVTRVVVAPRDRIVLES
jgi:hypothetical protein